MKCTHCDCYCVKVRYFPLCPQCGRDYVDDSVKKIILAHVQTYGAAKGAAKLLVAIDEDREALRRQLERQELWLESIGAVERAEQGDTSPRRLEAREIAAWTERAFKGLLVDFFIGPGGDILGKER